MNSIVVTSTKQNIKFGYEGEDNVTKIIFPYDESWLEYGEGNFEVRILRCGDEVAYTATEVVDDRQAMTLTMTVTDIELSVRGRGEMQLCYVCPDSIKKSPIYQYTVNRSIDYKYAVDPPDGSIIASVEKSLSEIKNTTNRLSNSVISIESSINDVNSQIDNINNKISEFDEEIDSVGEVGTKVDNLETSVESINGRINTAEGNINENAESISNLNESVTELENRKVTDLETSGGKSDSGKYLTVGTDGKVKATSLTIPTITVDTSLSTTSKNPVQNKVIKTELNNINSNIETCNTEISKINGSLENARADLDNTDKVLTLSKNTLEMEWEEGSITLNGTKVTSTAHRRTAYCIRLAKGSQLICSDGVKVRVVTFTILHPYTTVLDTATDYTTSYTANSDQYAMFAINSTDTSKIAIVAPYQYKREFANLSPDIWTEGSINTGGNIVTATGKYYTVPFYVGSGTYFECVGNTKCRVLCFDKFDIKNRKLISKSDDWVGFYTVPQNCFVQIVLSPQYDDGAITSADFGKLHTIIVPEDNHGLRLQWELGGITLATGTDNTSNYRYRTLFFKAKAGDYIECRSGYTMVVYEYTKEHPQNMRLITSNSSWVSSYVVRTDCICRLAVKKDDGTQVVVSNLQTMITITSSESHNRLLNAKKTFNVPSPEYKSAGLVPQGIWTVTYEDVYSWYDALVDNEYVTKETLGNDQSGTYPIYAYRFKPIVVGASFVSQNSETIIPVKAYPIKLLLCTATHGSERPSVLALYNAMYNIVNHWEDDTVLEFIRFNCEIVVVPLVNPYGFINRTRGNVNSVDINRNYNTNSWQYGTSDTSSPYYRGSKAASEAETRLMQNMIMSEPFDFVYDFHTHGNFTAYDQMFCWASCGNGFKELSFEIGQAVTKYTNASAIKNHGYNNTKMIGRNEVYADYAMIADFADKFCYAAGSPEVSYKLYDGNGSINSDAELTDSVKATNEEYIINSIIMSANSMH